MRRDADTYPPHWLKVARKDFQRVRARIADEDAEDAGFHLQQALEKYIKAYLLSQGWALRRTHDLEDLLNEMAVHEPAVARYTEVCQTISGFYMTDRYPSLDEELPVQMEDVAECLAQVTGLVELIEQHFAAEQA